MDTQFRSELEKARRRVRRYDKMDGKHGFATPTEVDERAFLKTLQSAIECGINRPETGALYDALAMIEQRLETRSTP